MTSMQAGSRKRNIALVQVPGSKKPFTIRPTLRSDEPILWEMLYHAIYVPEGTPPPPREVIQQPELGRYVQEWGRPGDLGLVAVETSSGLPVGAAWLRLLMGPEHGYGYIDDKTPELSIAVLPEHRGKGLGSRLLRLLLQIARVRYQAVSLSVHPLNPAVRLYRRMGFHALSESECSVVMRKDIR